jgi:uncharacterized membrane protein
MKLFKTVSMSTWEIGMVKIAVLCMGIAIGAFWSSIFTPYITVLIVTGVLVGLYAGYRWVRK